MKCEKCKEPIARKPQILNFEAPLRQDFAISFRTKEVMGMESIYKNIKNIKIVSSENVRDIHGIAFEFFEHLATGEIRIRGQLKNTKKHPNIIDLFKLGGYFFRVNYSFNGKNDFGTPLVESIKSIQMVRE